MPGLKITLSTQGYDLAVSHAIMHDLPCTSDKQEETQETEVNRAEHVSHHSVTSHRQLQLNQTLIFTPFIISQNAVILIHRRIKKTTTLYTAFVN